MYGTTQVFYEGYGIFIIGLPSVLDPDPGRILLSSRKMVRKSLISTL